MSMGFHSQFNEDAYRLPEGMRRVAYDADTECYTFRDRGGQLYQSAPGEEYGVLKPAAAPLAHRRNVTITEITDPALRERLHVSTSPKSFGDILPSSYITPAQSGVPTPSPTSALASSGGKLVRAAIPKVQGIVEIVRRRTTMKRFGSGGGGGGVTVSRSGSFADDKRRLLEDDVWEIVEKDDGVDMVDGRLGRSKSEMRPSRRCGRK